ncbi:enediyne antibiotic chromoprotein [Actinokineospora enzanensis]|uniref:enediyne antibiotic chromoprotein n=1 Tax=Actinokineospora enzanensis TaxID=155975 RepID=UPI000368CB4C|nr:enediyne antibiotic chromoprotein [Actinokineospora enzanensis]
MKTKVSSARVRVGLAAAAVLLLPVAAAPTAFAQPRDGVPQVDVEAGTNLDNDATVKVNLSGFEAGATVFIRQCAKVAEGVFNCASDDADEVTVDDEGTASADTEVHRVFEASDSQGAPLGEIDCAEVEHGCYVTAGNEHGGSAAEISFADGSE